MTSVSPADAVLHSIQRAISFAEATPVATLPHVATYASMVKQAAADAPTAVATIIEGTRPTGLAVRAAIDGVRQLGAIGAARGAVVEPLGRLERVAKLADRLFPAPSSGQPAPARVNIGADVPALRSAHDAIAALQGARDVVPHGVPAAASA